MAGLRMTKVCERCGATYTRYRGLSHAQWEERRYCGRRCAARAVHAARPKIETKCDDCGQLHPGGRNPCASCYNKRRWRDPELRDHNLKVRAEWRRQNPDYWKDERFRIKARRRAKARADADPVAELRRKAEYKRRRRVNAPPDPAAAEYAVILEGDPCAYCGGPSDSIDHIEPIADGGAHDWSNLTAACRSCNSSKWANTLLEFLRTAHSGEWACSA